MQHQPISILLASAICLSLPGMLTQPDSSFASTEGTEVLGHIIYRGDLPKENRIEITKDQEACGTSRTIQPVRRSPDNNGLQDAVVSLQDLPKKEPSRPATTTQIANRDCLFSPRTLVAMKGDALEIHNQDSILHNTHIKIKKRTILNVAHLSNSAPIKKRLKRFGMHNIRCDKHRFMEATLHVFSHPWFSVTDSVGAFRILNVPPGPHLIQVWHEILGILEKKVIIPSDSTISIQFEYPNNLID